jgi:carboxymethylenebutenolidase
MKNAGKFFEPVVYDGAGHGFFRAGEEKNASPANQNAREKGLARLRTILSSL